MARMGFTEDQLSQLDGVQQNLVNKAYSALTELYESFPHPSDEDKKIRRYAQGLADMGLDISGLGIDLNVDSGATGEQAYTALQSVTRIGKPILTRNRGNNPE